MKQIYFLLFFLLNISMHAQKIQRSAFLSSGNSIEVTTVNKTYYISQSIGQKGIIGTYQNNGYVLLQGFQQPLLVANKGSQADFKFSALVYPNPIGKKISVVLKEALTTDLAITIYDVLGKLQYKEVKKFPSKFDIDVSFLPTGTLAFLM